MAKPRTIYACTECGAQAPKWMGRCSECGSWSTLVEERVGGEAEAPRELLRPESGNKPIRLSEIDAGAAPRVSSGIAELDRVLGGGFVPGSVVLLAGEPGVGKSTLALQLAASLPKGSRVLYVAGEESPEQIRLRADRLPNFPDNLVVIPETNVDAVAAPWKELDPSLVLVDSIQTVRTERIESAAGSVAQVRESAALLSSAARTQGAALVLIGHVTKEGSIAGPRVLEHLVDVVLQFEGDRGHAFRLLRAHKNRFGSTREVGVFSMGEDGLETVENPSELFLAERNRGAPGSCIVPLVEGSRPMLVEIQALVAPAGYGTARRTPIGVDDGRLALLLAVLERRAGVDLVSRDVYVNVVGGVRISEPGADLALALALASSRLDIPLPEDVVACGEVGLGGEIRRVPRTDLRVEEAARLGFGRVLLPQGAPEAKKPPGGVSVLAVKDLQSAVSWLRDRAPTPTS